MLVLSWQPYGRFTHLGCIDLDLACSQNVEIPNPFSTERVAYLQALSRCFMLSTHYHAICNMAVHFPFPGSLYVTLLRSPTNNEPLTVNVSYNNTTWKAYDLHEGIDSLYLDLELSATVHLRADQPNSRTFITVLFMLNIASCRHKETVDGYVVDNTREILTKHLTLTDFSASRMCSFYFSKQPAYRITIMPTDYHNNFIASTVTVTEDSSKYLLLLF